MTEDELQDLILVVVGASLRAEEMDRPLAQRIVEGIRERLGPDDPWRPLIITDLLYLNDERLADLPVISIGGPGVNNLSAILFRELPSVLTIDNVLIIQMDIEGDDRRSCLWGMDHDQTVESLALFLGRGHLDHYLNCLRSRLP